MGALGAQRFLFKQSSIVFGKHFSEITRYVNYVFFNNGYSNTVSVFVGRREFY